MHETAEGRQVARDQAEEYRPCDLCSQDDVVGGRGWESYCWGRGFLTRSPRPGQHPLTRLLVHVQCGDSDDVLHTARQGQGRISTPVL